MIPVKYLTFVLLGKYTKELNFLIQSSKNAKNLTSFKSQGKIFFFKKFAF